MFIFILRVSNQVIRIRNSEIKCCWNHVTKHYLASLSRPCRVLYDKQGVGYTEPGSKQIICLPHVDSMAFVLMRERNWAILHEDTFNFAFNFDWVQRCQSCASLADHIDTSKNYTLNSFKCQSLQIRQRRCNIWTRLVRQRRLVSQFLQKLEVNNLKPVVGIQCFSHQNLGDDAVLM